MKHCPDCGWMGDVDEQTMHEHENGLCPMCGGGDVREINEDDWREDR